MEWLVIVISFGYGLFYVIWPETARQQYLSHFDVGSPTKWYKPNTYLTFEPPRGAFRLLGAVFIGIGFFLFYVWYSR